MAEVHDLVVVEAPIAFSGKTKIKQGVDVAGLDGDVFVLVPFPLPPPCNQREEDFRLPAPRVDDGFPSLVEEKLGDGGKESEDVEGGEKSEEKRLKLEDLVDVVLPEFFAEAHEREDGEDGVLEALLRGEVVEAGMGMEVLKKELNSPAPGGGEVAEAAGVESFRREVAAKEAPQGAVVGGGDVMASSGEEDGGLDGRRAVCEGIGMADQGGVGER